MKNDKNMEKNFTQEKTPGMDHTNKDFPSATKRPEKTSQQDNKPNQKYTGEMPSKEAGSFYKDTNLQIDTQNNYPENKNPDASSTNATDIPLPPANISKDQAIDE